MGLVTWSQFDISLFIGLRTNVGVADYKGSSHGEEVNMGVDQGSVVQDLGELINDQWIFPKVVLIKEDKLEIIGTVLYIATTTLFRNNYYSFGGDMYRQSWGVR